MDRYPPFLTLTGFYALAMWPDVPDVTSGFCGTLQVLCVCVCVCVCAVLFSLFSVCICTCIYRSCWKQAVYGDHCVCPWKCGLLWWEPICSLCHSFFILLLQTLHFMNNMAGVSIKAEDTYPTVSWFSCYSRIIFESLFCFDVLVIFFADFHSC